MSAPSPDTEKSDLLSIKISTNGVEIPNYLEVRSIRVLKEANRIPTASVEIWDGSAATQAFPASDSEVFVPGHTLTIEAGYHGSVETVFSGTIVRHGVRSEYGSQGTKLVVEGVDPAVKMTLGRQNACFIDTTDSNAMQQIVEKHGLDADVASTGEELPQLIQYYSTDWDFLLARAEANGLVVLTDGGKVSVERPDPGTSAALSLTFGFDILDFDLSMDARDQIAAAACSAWSYSEQELINATKSSGDLNGIGNLSTTELAEVVSPKSTGFQSTAAIPQSSLDAWAAGAVLMSEMSKVRGTLTCRGTSLVDPGDVVAIDGLGSRFDGSGWVGSVRHEMVRGQWTTRIGIGLPKAPSRAASEVAAPPASGLLPGIRGLQNGVVKKIDDDPENEFRVQVQVPILGPEADPVWARLTSIYATAEAGQFFYPEIDDEVLLGFLNDDPRYPVILGSLHSKTLAPKIQPAAGNPHKAITTKGGLQILFDDENKVLTLQTPAGNKAILSDEASSITVEDQNSNKVEMSEDGVSITSASKMTLSAPSGITIETDQQLTVSASTGITASGASISLSADGEFSASGGASASVSASGTLSINGSMVMIN